MLKNLFFYLLAALPLLTVAQKTDSLSYKSSDFKLNINTNQEEGIQPIELSISSVLFTDTIIGSSINKLINHKLYSYNNDSLNCNGFAFAASFLANYGDFLKDFPDNPMNWSIDKKAKVILNNQKLLTIEFFEFSYEGGAHPNTSFTLMMLDPQNAKEIHLEDILIPGSYQPLVKLCERYLRLSRNISGKANLEEEGFWLDKGALPLAENIALSNTGLRVIYNSYEIAPYAMGQSDFTIPYSELSKILKPEFLPYQK